MSENKNSDNENTALAAELPRRVDKPWGWEIHWAHTDKYVGKILHVKAGQALSFQYHRVKEETIYVQSGRIMLTRAEPGGEPQKVEMGPGDVLHVPPGLRHRFEALEDTDLLEASTPELDDVVRLEDRYGRDEG